MNNALKKDVLRKYQWYLRDDGRFITTDWKEIIKNAGAKEEFFDQMYSQLSLHSHPSNVSVFQFKDAFKDDTFKWMTFFAVRVSKAITAFFIRDYCEYFPVVKDAYGELPILNQLLVNSQNGTLRGEDYRINNAHQYV